MLNYRNANTKVPLWQAQHKESKLNNQTTSSKADQNCSRIRSVNVTVENEHGSSYVIEAVSLADLLA